MLPNDDLRLERALTMPAPEPPLAKIRRRAHVRMLLGALHRSLLCCAAIVAFGVALHAAPPTPALARVPTPLPAPSSHADV